MNQTIENAEGALDCIKGAADQLKSFITRSLPESGERDDAILSIESAVSDCEYIVNQSKPKPVHVEVKPSDSDSLLVQTLRHLSKNEPEEFKKIMSAVESEA